MASSLRFTYPTRIWAPYGKEPYTKTYYWCNLWCEYLKLPMKYATINVFKDIELCHFYSCNTVDTKFHVGCPLYYNPIRNKISSLFEKVVIGSLTHSLNQTSSNLDIILYLVSQELPHSPNSRISWFEIMLMYFQSHAFSASWTLTINFTLIGYLWTNQKCKFFLKEKSHNYENCLFWNVGPAFGTLDILSGTTVVGPLNLYSNNSVKEHRSLFNFTS